MTTPNSPSPTTLQDENTQMLVNRLRKNLRNVGKWARQQNISCYRLYDNDLPEYAFAIDVYDDKVYMAEGTISKVIKLLLFAHQEKVS